MASHISKVESSNRVVCSKGVIVPRFQIFGFFQENYMEKYTENIRSLAGYLNIMGKMAKDEKTKKMGLHLFDRSL